MHTGNGMRYFLSLFFMDRIRSYLLAIITYVRDRSRSVPGILCN